MRSLALVTLLGVTALAWAKPALALDAVRPSGYLERGQMLSGEGGPVFVPDSESGNHGGRYFRLSGSELGIFYGLGSHPSIDWFWPNHRVYTPVAQIIDASPAGLQLLTRYEAGADYTQGFARAGAIITFLALGATLGGFAYNLLPGNTREMQPIYFLGTGAGALAGLTLLTGSQLSASSNEALLNQAIDAYNRDMAGRRRFGPLPGR